MHLVTMKTFNKLQSKNIYTVLKFGKTQPIAVGHLLIQQCSN